MNIYNDFMVFQTDEVLRLIMFLNLSVYTLYIIIHHVIQLVVIHVQKRVVNVEQTVRFIKRKKKIVLCY